MVKVGFICEGKTEVLLLSTDNFNNFLQSIGIERVNVVNAETQGNLLPHNIENYIAQLITEGASTICILTDLDKDACITITKERINPRPQDIFIVAVKKIEAWFLANTHALQLLLNSADFIFKYPEKEDDPFLVINQLMVKHTGRGIGVHGKRTSGKIKLINKLIQIGIQIELSASHPNCPSAKYFINKLIQIGQQ